MTLSDLRRILETAFHRHYAVKPTRASLDEIRIVSISSHYSLDKGRAVKVMFPAGTTYTYRIDGDRVVNVP